ncbi:hypothetical protein LINPERHAP1_LOCUS29162 [Linum perenne]
MRAELRGAEMGLQLAWDLGFRKVELELDSLTAVQAIEGTNDFDVRHRPILHQIQ